MGTVAAVTMQPRPSYRGSSDDVLQVREDFRLCGEVRPVFRPLKGPSTLTRSEDRVRLIATLQRTTRPIKYPADCVCVGRARVEALAAPRHTRWEELCLGIDAVCSAAVQQCRVVRCGAVRCGAVRCGACSAV